jgi:hypothetical protein
MDESESNGDRILEALEEAGRPLTRQEIAEATGLKPNAITSCVIQTLKPGGHVRVATVILPGPNGACRKVPTYSPTGVPYLSPQKLADLAAVADAEEIRKRIEEAQPRCVPSPERPRHRERRRVEKFAPAQAKPADACAAYLAEWRRGSRQGRS